MDTNHQPGSLVLLPGLDGTGVLFRPLLGALPPSLPVTVVIYPPDQPLDYEALLPLVMAALPVASPFVLLGESFSGPLALRAAACRPAGLVGVVLSASFYRSPHPYLPSWIRGLVRPALLRIVPRFSQVKALLGGYSTEGIRLLVREALAQVTPEVFACRLRAVTSWFPAGTPATFNGSSHRPPFRSFPRRTSSCKPSRNWRPTPSCHSSPRPGRPNSRVPGFTTT